MDSGASATSSGVLVVDASGSVFSTLRSLNLGIPLWRVTRQKDADLANINVAIVAVYDEIDWGLVAQLADDVTTVVVATRPNTADACRAIAAGAFGYIDAALQPEAMRRSILGVIEGEHAYPRRMLATIIRNGLSLRAANALPLTPRQRQVIQLIAKGAADKEIAQTLGITTATAQKHVTNLLRRLNVPNRAAAVAAMSAVFAA
jgi:DNA-binding NarL/FixJ family response regulator